jgi:hypothetical protein
MLADEAIFQVTMASSSIKFQIVRSAFIATSMG